MKRFAFAVLLPMMLGGCAHLSYYLQSVGGQLEIMNREKPIELLLQDDQLDTRLRDKLQLTQRIREFAIHELALPNNKSYRGYADLQRPYVVWNVYATPEFSIKPRTWCFPVAGCVNYRGYFAEADAQAQAKHIAASGDDVYVSGVPAYSTLGWFADPVLNTFIQYPETELARLLFHELAHQIVYVQDDSVFNESFATVVEQAGISRWLMQHGSIAQLEHHAQLQEFRTSIRALIAQTRETLSQLYDSQLTDAEKRQRKAAAFESLKAAYANRKLDKTSFSGYDRWFAQPLGNAHLASVAMYTQYVPAFEALLAQHAGNLPNFYAAVRTLAGLPAHQRNEQLDRLTPRPKPQ